MALVWEAESIVRSERHRVMRENIGHHLARLWDGLLPGLMFGAPVLPLMPPDLPSYYMTVDKHAPKP